MPKRLTLVLAIATLCCLAANLADPFEGTKWKIKLTPDEEARKAGEKDIDDVISFKLNKFASEALANQGFAAEKYDADVRARGLGATFTVEMKSPSNGTVKWSGNTAMQSIQGQLIWTKKDKPLTFTFQGEKVMN